MAQPLCRGWPPVARPLGDEKQEPRVFPSCAREETRGSRGMPCLFLNTERGFGRKTTQKSGFRRHLAGSKMPEETFFTAISRWRVVSRRALAMPRVFGRGSRSQQAALISDRDDAALFPAIRILARYGSAKSGRTRRVRTACRRRGDPKRSSTICCRSFGLRARPSKAGPSRVPHSGERAVFRASAVRQSGA